MSAPEFSRPHRLGIEPRTVTLRASSAECAALAARYRIIAVESLEATLALVPEHGGPRSGGPGLASTVRARGTLVAAVVQECVVSLDPVAQRVEAPIDLRILPDDVEPADDDPDSPDEIESHGGMIDLGEAVAEQLALALDPYPRAPDAALPPDLVAEEEGSATESSQGLDEDANPGAYPAQPSRPNPFAALSRLKRH